MQIHELPTMSDSPTAGVYAAVDDGTSSFKLDYSLLAKAIIEEYTVLTTAGNNYSTKGAVNLLNTLLGTQSTRITNNTTAIGTNTAAINNLLTGREFLTYSGYTLASGYSLTSGGIWHNDNLVIIQINLQSSTTTPASPTDILTGLPNAISSSNLVLGCSIYANSITATAWISNKNKITVRPQAAVASAGICISGIYAKE